MRVRGAAFVTGRSRRVQAPRVHAVHARAWPGLVPLLLCGLLAGCGGASDGPVQWWHQLEGGRIAQDRPPPPNADAPYPNLASVPARPAVTPSDVRNRIADGLVADRANAAYGGSVLGLQMPRPAARPQPAADTSRATMAAATPPRGAPRGAVSSAPLPPVSIDGNVAPLAMPAIPPGPPKLPGVAQNTFAVVAPIAPPAPVAPVVAPKAGDPVALAFAPGSAVLPTDAAKALRALAAGRGTRTIRVTGFGDAGAVDADTQQAALTLALARARAIATALAQAGVPDAAVQVQAEAVGAGGVARILQ